MVESRYPVTVDSHIRIPMADGIELAATIHRPATAGAFPALLEPLPYRKDDWLIPGHLPMHAEFAARGYAAVMLDIRGTGTSGGVIEDEYTEAEIGDNLAVLAWLREQPWCDGALGMFGISWGGFAALQAAMRRPPGLAAIIPVGATHDRYALDVHYIGGTLHVNESVTWPVEMVAENALPPDPEGLGPDWRDAWLRRLEATPQWPLTWLAHQRRDEYWRHGSACADYAAIQVPVLAMNGFNDGYRDFVLELLEHLDVPRRGVLGPWGHSWAHAGWPAPSIDGIGLMTRWWDRWLKGIDNGVDREPMLAAYLAEPVPAIEYPDEVPGRWWFADRWPPSNPRACWRLGGSGDLVSLPDAAGRSATTGAPAASRSSRASGARSTWAGPPWVGATAPFWAGSGPPEGLPLDQRADEARSLCWTGEPLGADLPLLGQPIAELWVAASEPIAQVAVKVADVSPDGSSALVARGVLNLTRRHGLSTAEPLEPGRIERVEVRLQACGAIVPAGHRLRVAVAGADWPLAWPPPRAATLTIAHDADHPSAIHLPAASGLTTEGPDLGLPTALPTVKEPLPTSPSRSAVTHQADGGWLLTLDSEDAWRLPARELEWRSDEHLHISIGPDDPASCRAEGRCRITLGYADRPAIVASGRIVQACDPEVIQLDIELEVREGDAVVHERRWHAAYLRDLL